MTQPLRAILSWRRWLSGKSTNWCVGVYGASSRATTDLLTNLLGGCIGRGLLRPRCGTTLTDAAARSDRRGCLRRDGLRRVVVGNCEIVMVGYVARQTERQMTLTEWLSRTGCSSACPLVFGVVWGLLPRDCPLLPGNRREAPCPDGRRPS